MTDQSPDPPATRLAINPRDIPDDAHKVLRRLSQNGFDAYLVGGCVRDLLLGGDPKDFDIATSATPRQIKRLFRNSRIIGRRFRLVHIRFGHRVLEVATFRAPPDKDEGDDPYITRDNVFGTEEQDAFRRDLTINGLFYDLERKRVIDHVGGLADLEARSIRMIGDPGERLREDPVRILRAAKFAGRLDFDLTPDLKEAAREHAYDLKKAAPPRVLEEIYRLISNHGSPRSFRILEEIGAIEVLLPEVSPLPDYFYDALVQLQKISGGARDGVPQALMIAVLLEPLVRGPLLESKPIDYEALVADLIRPIGLRLTVARRDLTYARQAFAAQMRFLHPPVGRPDRRFVLREIFPLALDLREVLGPLAPVDPDPLPEWLELARHAHAGHAHGGGKKRRKRRGRGRRGGRRLRTKTEAGKEGASPSPSDSSSAPAPPTPPRQSPPVSSSGDSSPA